MNRLAQAFAPIGAFFLFSGCADYSHQAAAVALDEARLSIAAARKNAGDAALIARSKKELESAEMYFTAKRYGEAQTEALRSYDDAAAALRAQRTKIQAEDR